MIAVFAHLIPWHALYASVAHQVHLHRAQAIIQDNMDAFPVSSVAAKNSDNGILATISRIESPILDRHPAPVVSISVEVSGPFCGVAASRLIPIGNISKVKRALLPLAARVV